MTDLSEAFKKAGLPPASISFAAACHDLARLALNRQPDPERAVAVALGMMSGNAEFRARLREFLAEVALERPGKPKLDGVDQTVTAIVMAEHGISRPSDLNGDAEDHRRFGANGVQSGSAPASPPQISDGADQLASGRNAQDPLVPPSETRLHAMAMTKRNTALVTSGFKITERNGQRTAIEDVRIDRLDRLAASAGKYAATRALEYNVLLLMSEKARRIAFVPPHAKAADIFSPDEIRDTVALGRAFAAGPMITLPEELRVALLGEAA